MYEILFYLLKRPLIGLCFSLVTVTTSFAQTSTKIDSLELLLKNAAGPAKHDLLIELLIQHAATDNIKALSYAEASRNLAKELGDSLRLIKSQRLMGQLYNRLDRTNEAIDIMTMTLPMAKRLNQRQDYKIMLNGLALAYSIMAEYDKALEVNFQSLVLREEDGDKKEISISMNNIGMVYFKLKNYHKALEYYSRSHQLKSESNDRYDLDRLLINIGLCYNQLRDYSKANEYIESGFETCGEECSSQIKVEGEFGLGVSNYGLLYYEEAEKHFTKSFEIAKSIDNKRFQAENLVYLGRSASKQKKFSEAIKFLKTAEMVADSSGYNQLLIDVYKEFSSIFKLAEDYRQASFYQTKYISLKDSLIGEDLVKNVAKIQSNFEERENIATIKLKEDALIRQRNLNIAIGVIAVLAGLLVFVLYRSNTVTRKVNSALSDAKGIIETQNLRLQNINRELDGKVKEKTANLEKAVDDLDKANQSLSQVNGELDNFIYKTSHDIRGPLASLKGICSVALLDVKDPLALDYLNKLDVSSGRLNVILTRLLIVNQINNAIVGKEPIDFNEIVDDVILLEKKKGVPARFEIRREIEKDVQLQSDKDLVRIILENLIDNAIKFHNDSERVNPFVHIKIRNENAKRVEVSVIDNGIGIAEAKPDKIFQMFSRASERSGTGGIGLYLSKLATEKLGGEIHLRNTKEGFTEFYVAFPTSMPVA